MAETMKKMAAAALAACALCLALVPGIAWAAVDPEAVVEGAGDGAAVSLKLPDGPRDDVRTLRLGLTVTAADLEGVQVDFAFDGSLDGVAVKEARYRHEGGVGHLNLYLAGNKNLYENDVLKLGTVKLTGADGTTVGIGAGELGVVSAAHDASEPTLFSTGPVTVEIGAATPNPPDPPAGGGEAEGGDAGGDEGGSGSGSGSGSGTGGGAGDGSGSGGADADANRSPGAPSGTEQPLMATGDGLAVPLAVCGAVALAAVAAAACSLARRPR